MSQADLEAKKTKIKQEIRKKRLYMSKTPTIGLNPKLSFVFDQNIVDAEPAQEELVVEEKRISPLKT